MSMKIRSWTSSTSSLSELASRYSSSGAEFDC